MWDIYKAKRSKKNLYPKTEIFWCWRGDSNSQAEAYAPQAYVYTIPPPQHGVFL